MWPDSHLSPFQYSLSLNTLRTLVPPTSGYHLHRDVRGVTPPAGDQDVKVDATRVPRHLSMAGWSPANLVRPPDPVVMRRPPPPDIGYQRLYSNKMRVLTLGSKIVLIWDDSGLSATPATAKTWKTKPGKPLKKIKISHLNTIGRARYLRLQSCCTISRLSHPAATCDRSLPPPPNAPPRAAPRRQFPLLPSVLANPFNARLASTPRLTQCLRDKAGSSTAIL